MKAPDLYYYANARLGGKTALLAGPFLDAETAQNVVDRIGQQVITEYPDALIATFGVLSVVKHDGYGLFNWMLRGSGLMILQLNHREPVTGDTRPFNGR